MKKDSTNEKNIYKRSKNSYHDVIDQNINDAQKSYELEIEKKSKRMQPTYSSSFVENKKSDFGIDSFEEKKYETDHKSSFDKKNNDQNHGSYSRNNYVNSHQNIYVKNQNVEDAQKTYERELENKQIKRNNSDTHFQYSLHNKDEQTKDITDKKEKREGSFHTKYREQEHRPHFVNDQAKNTDHSYVRNQNVEDAQKAYEKEIENKQKERQNFYNPSFQRSSKENNHDFNSQNGEKQNRNDINYHPTKRTGNTDDYKTTKFQNDFSHNQRQTIPIKNTLPPSLGQQNIDEAQKDFYEKIKSRQNETFNYKSPFCNSGHFTNKDYKELFTIDSRGEYSRIRDSESNAVKSKIGGLSDFGRTIQKGTFRYFYDTTTESTDARRAIDEYRDIHNLTIRPVLDSTRHLMGAAMKSELIHTFQESIPILVEAKILSKDYVIPSSKKELANTMMLLNKYVKQNNLVDLRIIKDPSLTTKPYSKRAQYLLRKALRNPKLTKVDRQVLKLLLKYSRYQTISGIKHFRGIRYITRMGTRFARRDQTMYVTLATAMFAQRSLYLYRTGKMFSRNLYMISKLASKKAYKRYLQTHIKVLKSKMACAVDKSSVVKKTLNKGRQINQNRRNITRGANNRFEKIKRATRDPFHVKTRFKRVLSKTTNKIPGFKYVKKAFNFLGSATSKVMAGFSLLKTIILTGLMIILLTILIMMLIMYIMKSNFSFDSVEEKIRNKCLNQIQVCFDEQNRNLSSYYNKYRNVNINFAEEKDHEEYELPEHTPDSTFTETTNAAEILSMTQVRFDFDLPSAKEREVIKYVKELYNGSHRTSITEHRQTIENEDGSTYDVVDADITLTTVYFNGLFDCKLTNKAPGIIAGNTITEKTWNFLITSGIPPIAAAGIMGNIQAESGFNPSIIEGGSGVGFGLCQWSYDRRSALENYAASKKKPPSDLQTQLEFLVSELTPGHFNAYHTGEDSYTRWYNAKTTDEATYYFMWGWERPLASAGVASYSLRCNAAKMYYEMYKDNPIPQEENKDNSTETAK